LTSSEPCFLTASEASALIGAGKLSCEELARSCLARIAAREPAVRAWLYLDPEQAIRNAREIDKSPRLSALHGLPFGVKDVIDTADMPTTQNSPIYRGTQVGRDAACVAVARHSGALILGKTDTVEFGDAASDGPDAHTGRIVQRVGRGGGRFHDAAGVRHADRRVAYPAGLVQRHLRHQAHPWRGQPRGGEDVLAHAGHDRLVWPLRG
jgi:hypothetical protein